MSRASKAKRTQQYFTRKPPPNKTGAFICFTILPTKEQGKFSYPTDTSRTAKHPSGQGYKRSRQSFQCYSLGSLNYFTTPKQSANQTIYHRQQ